MRLLAAAVLAALAVLGGALTLAAPPLSEAEVRTFMGGVQRAAQARDVGRLADALSPDCRIELATQIDGREQVTLMTRDEYVEMLTSGYAALKDLEAYVYTVDDEQITLEPGAAAATVVSQVTETAVFRGERRVTRSEETARVERRGQNLKVVAVSALTKGG